MKYDDATFKESLGLANTPPECMQVCQYEGIQVCRYSMQECKHASMQVCKYASMQECKYAIMIVRNYAIMQVCKVMSKQFSKKWRDKIQTFLTSKDQIAFCIFYL